MLKIYLTNLGKYNEGELVGEWVELPIEQDELNEVFVRIGLGKYDEDGNYSHGVEIDDVYYEEWFITDYEKEDGFDFEVSEYSNIFQLNRIVGALDGLEEYEVEAVCYLINNYYNSKEDIEEVVKRVRDCDDIRFYHDCRDMSDVAYTFLDETGELQQITKYLNESYIDFDSMGRDMEINGDFTALSNDIYMEVFN